jgi:hypothetical protein
LALSPPVTRERWIIDFAFELTQKLSPEFGVKRANRIAITEWPQLVGDCVDALAADAS